MNTTPRPPRRTFVDPFRLLPGALLLLGLNALAATAPTSPGASAPTSNTQADPVTTLSPFEVSADSDIGYESSTVMSGTRTNESLANLPNSISVINAEFMSDLGITDFFEAVEFAVGADNIYNDNMQVGAAVGTRSGNQINFRGLPSNRQLKDGFPTYTPQDSYNTERIEISRGPGGIAYGDTDATGVINVTTKRAKFKNAYEVQARFDDLGSQRVAVDLNQSLLDQRLAMRVNLLDSDLEGWHENTARVFKAVSGAVRFQPFKSPNTIIDATYEDGRFNSYFSHTALNNQMAAYIPGSGTNARDADPNRSGIQTNGVGMARLAGPRTNTNDVHAMSFIEGRLYNLQTMGNTDAFPVYRFSTVTQGANATSANDPRNPDRIPILPVPASLIPYDQDWAGPDARVRYTYDVTNLSVQQRVTRNFNLWFAYNRQNELADQSLTRNGNIVGGNVRAVFIDVNPRLPDPAFPNDPTRTIANPNFEQLFIAGTLVRRFQEHNIDSYRLIGVHNLTLGKTAHRFILSVNHRDEIYRNQNMNFGLTKEEIDRRGYTGPSARLANNVVTPWYYFKDGNGEKLRNPRQPGVMDYFIAGSGGLQFYDQSLSSGVFQHLGTFFNGRLRTSVGISRDHWKQAINLPTRSFGDYQEWRFVDAAGNPVDSNSDDVPTRPGADTWRTNTSYGAVYRLTDWVSATASYQQSALFTENVGTDLNGEARRPTTGSGVDLGLRFRLLANRLNASVVYYNNVAENQRTGIGAARRTEVNAALETGLPGDSPDAIIGLDDSNDRETRGLELELTANFMRNWTTRLVFATSQNQRASSVPQLRAKVALAEKHLQSQGFSTGDIQTALADTYDYIADLDDSDTQPRQYRGNIVSRYEFREGRLKGLSIGGSARWARGRARDPGGLYITGQLVIPETQNADEIIVSPFFKYSAKIGRVRWTGQLNIDNVFDRVTDQGRISRYPRFTAPRSFTLTNFFRF